MREANIKNPYNESNFKIQPVENGFLVRSDSRRFGKNEIVFQGISYAECLQYIDDRINNIEPSYYVIKDLASWRNDVWEKAPEKSKVERFATVEETIEQFNKYLVMDYLKEEVIDSYTKEPMRRLALGVSYTPHKMAEMDLLHVESGKVLLISDAVAEREYGYESFMTNSKFIRDLNKIAANIQIDVYSYYRDMTIEELAESRMKFIKENYPEADFTMEEAMDYAALYVRQHPYYLKQNQVNERVPFENFNPPYLYKGTQAM